MKFVILGCGSSMGVPRPDGFFGKCNPKNPRNYRSRCSALIKTKNETILIDTSPDLRQQSINNKIRFVDKVFYSHMHADQTHGINDLRVFYLKNKKMQIWHVKMMLRMFFVRQNIIFVKFEKVRKRRNGKLHHPCLVFP